MERRTLRNLEFNTEYLPKLRQRVAQNKRFEIIKLRRNIQPNNNMPGIPGKLSTNITCTAQDKRGKQGGSRSC